MSTQREACVDRTSGIRKLVFCALAAEVRQRHEPLYCIDALAGSGKAGLEWKQALKDQVHVTLADRMTADTIKSSQENDLTCRDLTLDFSRIPGDPMEPQGATEIFVSKCSPDVILHMESFDFVHINPTHNLINYIGSAMTNLKHNGLLSVTSTDLSSKFTRSSQVIKRYYCANVIKTSYMKELALRIVLANIVRSAAKCNKGIDVLLSSCIQDQFLIIVRVLRGVKEGDRCVEKITPLLHCQMCEERVFYPNSLSPQEEPYKLLPCTCNNNNPGKTAVILGPVWSGELFNISFLDTMLHVVKDMNICVPNQLNMMMEEATCSNQSIPLDKEPEIKRVKLSPPELLTSMPPFYINLHSLKLKSIEIPKFGRLLEYLKQKGHHASRTHLDCYAVRTNATMKQLSDILYKNCKKKS